MDKFKFGEFIYTQRKKVGYTQDELGRKLNVTNKAVSKWETGETLPDVQLLPKLASVLNVTIDELLTQQKPELEKVYVDPKKPIRIILWVLCSIFLIVSISLGIILTSMIQKEDEEILITTENVEEYFTITPCQNIVADGYNVDIYGSIFVDEKVVDPELLLNFTIQIYYINTDGENELSEILYFNRRISYDESNNFSIILRPKNPIKNFKSIYKVNVSYVIEEASGRYID